MEGVRPCEKNAVSGSRALPGFAPGSGENQPRVLLILSKNWQFQLERASKCSKQRIKRGGQSSCAKACDFQFLSSSLWAYLHFTLIASRCDYLVSHLTINRGTIKKSCSLVSLIYVELFIPQGSKERLLPFLTCTKCCLRVALYHVFRSSNSTWCWRWNQLSNWNRLKPIKQMLYFKKYLGMATAHCLP